MSCLGDTGYTKSWEADDHDQQLGENDSIGTRNCKRLRKAGNDEINKLSAMWPGFAKIIEKLCILTIFEYPETALHIAVHAYYNHYADTEWSKQV